MSGTYVDKQAPRIVMGAFLAVALVLAIIPFAGMLWARTDSTTENRELAPAPSLTEEDGSFNLEVLSDAGTYFGDHFACRNALVAANAHLRALLGSSPTDQVVVGSDGWLYYGGTLNDYLGRSALSDRSLANIAHNLKLTQGYVESKGARFAFALAPNKNTLYDQSMPAYYVRCPDPSNAERLKPLLDQAGVTYVDLFGLLSGQGEVLYLQRDTHWDNRGALLAANALLSALGASPASADPSSAVAVEDFVGDLQSMLYPGEGRAERNFYYAGFHEQATGDEALAWAYEEGADVTDNLVRTAGSGEGSMLVFRDSFGNALIPFLAASSANATFSKLVPYNMTMLAETAADSVVIERAERHLSDLATAPPFVPSPTLAFPNGAPEGAREVQASVEVSADGSYWVVTGAVDEGLSADDRLYVAVSCGQEGPVVYDPFWLSFADESGAVGADNGFLVYIPMSAAGLDASAVHVYVK